MKDYVDAHVIKNMFPPIYVLVFYAANKCPSTKIVVYTVIMCDVEALAQTHKSLL